ncbi:MULTISPECIES: 2-dehydropantoate 2-reductase [unclassified Minwuia]|jgi:2-dehydropantoate 2-reductase|uniref:2-dehydropantoate 2-reductase n=1 Tax=unclassified Minwuia TaxID=2618799 RepID=UPI0024786B1B|nr:MULTISPECIES: 2-dehydropantoate 2-reductase [unclassified Minwuia]
MKICIYGAGAIGGYVGAMLSRAGADVSLIARGPHLAAIRENGLRLKSAEDDFTVHPRATDDPSELGPQDYVLLTLKAHGVRAVADAMQPLLGPDTAVVTAQNGMPWWYFHGLEGKYAGQRLVSADPGNELWDKIGPERVIGSVVWQAAEVPEPGVVQLGYGERLSLGEPDGSKSDRIQALSSALVNAGVKAPIRPNIRNEIWVKLWGNLSFNPVSALTGATLVDMAQDAGVGSVIHTMMTEAKAVGEALDVRFPMTVEKRITSAEKVGAHKTSMLQDLEGGRTMEIEPIIGTVSELGRITGIPTPIIDTVYHLTVLRAKQAGCYTA